VIRRLVASGAVTAAAAALLGGCTGTSRPKPKPTPGPTITQTVVDTVAPHPSPVDVGPTTSASGTCRLLSERVVRDAVGMRLARVTVQRAGGKQIGCTFYALQHSPLHNSEHLPGPHQPAARFSVTRYPDATAAHNAMILTADAGRNPQQVDVGAGRVGLAYRVKFYPRDHGKDWACAFNVGAKLAVIKTVSTDASYNVVTLAKKLRKRIRGN
jgi:hypothetical protein